MKFDVPEPLWREVVGDTEPWRRGRLFLVLLAIWELIVNCVALGRLILLGRVELLVMAVIGIIIFWLLFYFIWVGVHWVRWISGGFLCLVAFANLIWGIRDGNVIRLIDGSIGFPIAAYLALAPSVYFFALRQKEIVRCKESLVIAGVFGLLLASAGATAVGLFSYKSNLEARGRVFADQAFRRIFIDGEEPFLRRHVTERLLQEEGWDRLSWFMTDRHLRLGAVRELQPARGRLQFVYRFPTALFCHGRVSSEALGKEGRTKLHLQLIETGGEWQIDGIWWQYSYD